MLHAHVSHLDRWTGKPGSCFGAAPLPADLRAGHHTVFLWAIPNNLNDILIRQFMKSFVMTRFEAGMVQFAFYLRYWPAWGCSPPLAGDGRAAAHQLLHVVDVSNDLRSGDSRPGT